MRNSTSDRATVAVIGGGPAGASAALTLARHGIPALLLEQSDGSGNPDGECLAPTANPLLHRLGLYECSPDHTAAAAPRQPIVVGSGPRLATFCASRTATVGTSIACVQCCPSR